MKRNDFLKGLVGTISLAVIPKNEIMAMVEKAKEGYWHKEMNKLYQEMSDYLISIMKPCVFYKPLIRSSDVEFAAFIKDSYGEYVDIRIRNDEKWGKNGLVNHKPHLSYTILKMYIDLVSKQDNIPVKDWEPEYNEKLEQIKRYLRGRIKEGERQYLFTKLSTLVSRRNKDNIELNVLIQGETVAPWVNLKEDKGLCILLADTI